VSLAEQFPTCWKKQCFYIHGQPMQEVYSEWITWPWRRRHCDPLKHGELLAEWYITLQNTWIFSDSLIRFSMALIEVLTSCFHLFQWWTTFVAFFYSSVWNFCHV
jgi:hypothetical protein